MKDNNIFIFGYGSIIWDYKEVEPIPENRVF